MSLIAPQDAKADGQIDLSVDELAVGMQKLPLELFDLIYDLTFQASPSVCRIDGKYKPPAILQVRPARSRHIWPERNLLEHGWS